MQGGGEDFTELLTIMKGSNSKSAGWVSSLETQGQAYVSFNFESHLLCNLLLLREVSLFCSIQAFIWLDEAHSQL
jgi:hypothetical protein